MASTTGQDIGFGQRPLSSGPPLPARNVLPCSGTTPAERFLLLATIILLPLQVHIPAVAGFSSLFLVFAVLAGYVMINRPRFLDRIWIHPVFVAAYIFLFVSGLCEFTSPLSMYDDIARSALMVGGAIVVATLCRDRLALGACLYGYIAAALWLSVVLFLTSYGTLRGVAATDFIEATQVRAQVFSDTPVKANLNALAFTCLQGGVVAFAFTLSGVSLLRRRLFFAIAIFCFVASFLTMSRGSVAIAVLSCAAILYARGIGHGRAFILAGVLCACVFLLVPDVIWSRMAFSTEGDQGKEGRAVLYTAALEHLPEYIVTGVGAGNFWKKWGFEKGFARGSAFSYDVGGVHNSFLQVTIYWGVLGLFSFIGVIWQAYRCLPTRCGNDPLALSLLGIAVSLVLLLPFTHNFYDKMFSLGLGMLVASRYWVWLNGIVQPIKQQDVVSVSGLL